MMMFHRAKYHLVTACDSIRESFGLSALAVATIGAALFLLGAYAMALRNFETLATAFGRSTPVAVVISDDINAAQRQALQVTLEQMPAVGSVTYVDAATALARFRARGEQARALVLGVDETILPSTFELALRIDIAHVAQLEAMAREIEKIPGVAQVDYGRAEFEQLRTVLHVLRSIGLLGGVGVALATAFIVAGTIRLTVYGRRDEIGILQLVGATGGFVRTPFLIEGGVFGAAGGLFAAAALFFLHRGAAAWLSQAFGGALSGFEVQLFVGSLVVWLVCGGVGLGVCGSALAVRRFMQMEHVS